MPSFDNQKLRNITEKAGLRFRAEFFNIFNHPNFGNPNNNLPTLTAPNPLFGHSTQTLASSLGVRWREWRFQPSLPDRRTALDPAGA